MAEIVTKLPVKEEKTAELSQPGGFWKPLGNLRQEVDRLFEDFDRGVWHSQFRNSAFDVEPFWQRSFLRVESPAVDITEKEKFYEITAELPGLSERDIEVKVSDGTLMIKGEKKEEKEEKKKDYFLSERRYGSFERRFGVPQGVDVEKIEAAFKNGVLTLTLPKTAEAQKKSKNIQVKAA